MSPTTSSHRHRRPLQRPSKRLRRMPATESIPRTPPYEQHHSETKRKRHTSTPSSCRKRRRSTAETHSPHSNSAKKARLFKPDVEMVDAHISANDTPSRKKRNKILKDILRSERISRSILRNLHVNADVAQQQRQPQSETHTPAYAEHCHVHTQRSQPNVRAQLWQHPVELTGEEQVEEVDISQCSETDRTLFGERTSEQDRANPMQTYLAEDGRCFVRIVREDGVTDYYVLHPHSHAQGYYYEY